MTGILIALFSGAAGVLLSAFARALGVPGDVGRHDASIRGRDAALATWIADRHYALQEICEMTRESIFPTSELPSSPQSWFYDDATDEATTAGDPWKEQAKKADKEIAQERSTALWEYRDQCAHTVLDVEQILASEGWPHRLYRRLARRAIPPLTAPEQATPLIDAWRRPSGMSGEAQVWPDDATQRTLARALRTIPVTGP